MHVLLPIVALVAGFGLGRIKNASKLAAIKTGLDAIEAKVGAEAKTVIALVRKEL